MPTLNILYETAHLLEGMDTPKNLDKPSKALKPVDLKFFA
jgi:hypothetical protein